MMESYCLYLRKSRADREAEQRGEGETFSRHEKELSALAEKMQISISQIYKEVVSGETIASRPVMTHLLEEVEQGIWTGVFVMEVERLARGDTIDQGIIAQAFKFSGTKIITPAKIYNPDNEFDEEYFEFGLFMSRREYKTINRRLQKGRIASVNEGKYAGNVPPYGYERRKLSDDKGFILSPISEQAAVVKMIYQLYAYGEEGNSFSIAGIAKKLNDLNLPSAKGKDWTPSAIRGILSNPVYIGKLRWNYRKCVKKVRDGKVVKSRPYAKEYLLKDGLHEAIIEESLFSLVQNIRSKSISQPVREQNTLKNPLAGLIFCSKCGRHMVRKPMNDKLQAELLICPSPKCPTVSSPLYLVEEKIISSLSDYFSKYSLNSQEIVHCLCSETELLKEKLKQQKKLLSSALEQKEKLYSFLEQGLYSPAEFKERSYLLHSRITALEASVRLLKANLQKSTQEYTKAPFSQEKNKALFDYYRKLTIKQQNELLKILLEKAVYEKECRNSYRQGKTASFTLHLYPKLPADISCEPTNWHI